MVRIQRIFRVSKTVTRKHIAMRHEYRCCRKGQKPALLLLAICRSFRQTDGEASSVWGTNSTHPSGALNPDLIIAVGVNAELTRLCNTVGLGDLHGSK